MDADRYGPWAIVTGAAVGMGEAFADALAAAGLSLVLVDVDAAALAATAARLRAGGTEVVEVVVDLSTPGAAEVVLAAAESLEVGLLVSNAALSSVSAFNDQSLESKLAQLEVNCRVPLVLVHHLLPAMVARGRGGVVLLSSGSALRGTPIVASYAATKAWNLILAESLWDEVRADGVDVLAVLPGSTRTPGWLSSDAQDSVSTRGVMEPVEVVADALDALGRQASVVAGQANRDGEAYMVTLDRTAQAELVGQVMRQTYPGRLRG